MESINGNPQNHNPHVFFAENVPAEMTREDSWLLWHGEWDGHKLKKRPYRVGGGAGSSTDPETWTTFERAAETASARNEVFGPGYVFTAESPLGGMDLDGCVEPETGEIKPWAREIIDSAATYAEISPSGTGVKLIGHFRLPPMSGHKKVLNEETGEAIEVYDRGRFFTVTGRVLPGTPGVVRDIQFAVEGVLNRYFAKSEPPAEQGAQKPSRKLRDLAVDEEKAAIEAIADHLPKNGLQDLALAIARYLLGKTHAPAVKRIMIAAWDQNGLIKSDGSGLAGIVDRTAARMAAGERSIGGPSIEKRLPEMYKALQAALKPTKGAAQEGNQAQRLIRYAREAVEELFLDQNGSEYALVEGAPMPLDRGCYGWLRRLFWEREEAAATTDLLGTAAGQLRAFAEISGNEHTLHLRAAQHGGAVYLYLGPGRVLRVDSGGWELDPAPPVMFRPVLNLKDLPDPERGGTLEDLDIFITAKEPRDHRLAKAWLVLALLTDTNRPILLAHGPQGSTKSSVQRVLKNIIDPAKPTTLKLREKDFEQNINKAFIPFFDNISNITDHMADELSKAVTGAGNAVRKLYEDDADVIREYRRAMLLNGLVIPTEKADLIDRLLPVALKRVEKKSRETEKRMQGLFDARHPKLLGAVLSALSGAIQNHQEIRGRELPRMADWAEYAIALYEHLGWYDGGTTGYEGFWADWAVIEEGQHAVTLEGSAVAQAVVAIMKAQGPLVQRSPAKMLGLLHDAAESEGLDPDKDKEFPKHARWLWRKIVPVIPTLESFGIKATSGKDESKTRYIRFELDTTPNPEPEDKGQQNASGANNEKMMSPSDPHTYAKGTTGTTESSYLPRNSKYTEDPRYKGVEDGLLFSGKNDDSVDSDVTPAYLLGGEGDNTSDDVVPEGGYVVPEPEDEGGGTPDDLDQQVLAALVRLHDETGEGVTDVAWEDAALEDGIEWMDWSSSMQRLLRSGAVRAEGVEEVRFYRASPSETDEDEWIDT
jgi:hypothetical protein